MLLPISDCVAFCINIALSGGPSLFGTRANTPSAPHTYEERGSMHCM